jgi:peptidoglycan/xylan/chitin deacetylase (PgdA/CDA1 family)
MHDNLCLCLHCIRSERDPEPRAHRELFIEQGGLQALFTSLKSEGYRFALPGDAGDGGGPVCCVTFDDGYFNNRHFLETAERFGIPFIMFLNSYNVVHQVPFIWDIWEATRTEPWPVSSVSYLRLYESLTADEKALLATDTHRPFTPEELAAFTAHPLVHLAPHGHTHQPLVGLYTGQTDGELDANLAFLENYKGVFREDFSLPCGLYTRKLIRTLLGRFTRIYTIDGGGFSTRDRVIHRISLIHPDYGGPLREQIRASFGAKTRLMRKAQNLRYSNRLLARLALFGMTP